jgi:hypothetical protein
MKMISSRIIAYCDLAIKKQEIKLNEEAMTNLTQQFLNFKKKK